MTKNVRRLIIDRSRLKRVAHRTKDTKDIAEYKKQRNTVVLLNKAAKKTYFENLYPIEIGKNKVFWRTSKPLLSNNCQNRSIKLALMENGSLLTDDKDVSECFSTHFTTITDTLDIERLIIEEKSVLAVIERYRTHPDMIKIEQLIKPNYQFNFCKFGTKEVWYGINRLDGSSLLAATLPQKC